jgi:glycosyltransferase involved in cell wall biosynthesis
MEAHDSAPAYEVDGIGFAGRTEPRPEVSVVIPTRDRPRLVVGAVTSALAQRGATVEVIVVEDGSAVTCAGALRGLAETRVRMLRRDGPAGVAAARNAGIAAAAGTWIALLDDDDRWSPDKLARQLSAAAAALAGAASCGVLAVDAATESVFDRLSPPEPDTLAGDILRKNVVPAPGSNVVVRRDVLDAVGPLDEQFAHLDDWDLWIRVAQRTRIAAVADGLVGYRYHGRNRSLLEADVLAREFDLLAEKHRALASGLGVGPDRVDFGRFLAWSARHTGHRRVAAQRYWQLAVRERDVGSAVRAPAALLGERALSRFSGKPARGPAPGWAHE